MGNFDSSSLYESSSRHAHVSEDARVGNSALRTAENANESREQLMYELGKSVVFIGMWGNSLEYVAGSHEPRVKENTMIGHGSGGVVAVDGQEVTIMTNAHVAADKQVTGLTVEFRKDVYSGNIQSATVIYVDEKTDVALIKVSMPKGATPPKPVQFGDSSALSSGQVLTNIGSPFGFPIDIKQSRTTSEVMDASAKTPAWAERHDNGDAARISRSLKIQGASTAPGSSGGMYFNDQGEMVGLHWAGQEEGGSRVAFAIRGNDIQLVAKHSRLFARIQQGINEVVESRIGENEARETLKQSFKRALRVVRLAISEYSPGSKRETTLMLLREDYTDSLRRQMKALLSRARDHAFYEREFRNAFYGESLYGISDTDK